jgi:DNA-binding LytR/AlgR family response regulator
MRLAVRQSSRRFVMVDVDDVYYVESVGHDTLIRLARRSKLKSVRPLADIERLLVPRGFARVHRSYLVNLDRVREVRLRRGDDNDWELKLDPPVNTVLPIARNRLESLRKTLGF